MSKPDYLQLILYDKLKNALRQCVKDPTGYYDQQRKELREYFAMLPLTVREEILYLGLCPYFEYPQPIEDENSSEIILFFLEVLFSPNMNISLRCIIEEDYFEKILQCLLAKGKGIKYLEFHDEPVSLDPLRQSEFLSMVAVLITNNCTTLVKIELGANCSDYVLREIGQNCQNLQFLNISESEVTDKGIQELVVIFKCGTVGEMKNEEIVEEALLLPERNLIPCTFSNSIGHKCCFRGCRTKLCHTLKYISLGEISISVKALDLVFKSVTGLVNVELSLDKFLDKLFENYNENPAEFEIPVWKMCSMCLYSLNTPRLHMLNMLSSTNTDLSSLAIYNFMQSNEYPASEDVRNYFKVYGKKLTELVLNIDYAEFELSFFLRHCPNLISLDLDVYRLTWGGDKTPIQSPNLKTATLSVYVNPLAVVLFLKSASALEEVKIAYIGDDGNNNADGNFLLALCNTKISEKLTKFYIWHGETLRNPLHVATFWQYHPHVTTIGNVSYRVEALGMGNGIKLRLN